MRSEIWRDTDPRPHRAAALRLRATASATRPMSTGRSTCRCTSSSAARPTTTWRAPRSATSWPGGWPQLPGERATLSRLGEPPFDAVPRGSAQAVPGDARRRRGPPAMIAALPAFWAGLFYDEAALDAAWDLVQRLVARRSRAAARRRASPRLVRRRSRAGRFATSRRDPGACRGQARRPGHAGRNGPGRDPLPRSAGGDRRRPARPRPSGCSTFTGVPGMVRSNRRSGSASFKKIRPRSRLPAKMEIRASRSS